MLNAIMIYLCVGVRVRNIYLEPDFLAEQSLIWPIRFVEAGDEGTNTSC